MGIKSLFGFSQARDKPIRNYSNGEYSFSFGRSTSGKSVNEMTAMQTTAVYNNGKNRDWWLWNAEFANEELKNDASGMTLILLEPTSAIAFRTDAAEKVGLSQRAVIDAENDEKQVMVLLCSRMEKLRS